jgi:hypothetical protein
MSTAQATVTTTTNFGWSLVEPWLQWFGPNVGGSLSLQKVTGLENSCVEMLLGWKVCDRLSLGLNWNN